MPLNPAAEDVLGRLGTLVACLQEGAGDKALEARPGGGAARCFRSIQPWKRPSWPARSAAG